MPLQCTAFTEVPQGEGARALWAIPEIEEDWRDIVPSDTLCELGEHDEYTEHAAVLWFSPDVDNTRLWTIRWADVGRFTICRFELGTQCLAKTPGIEECLFFTHHPSGHSWEVTDPVMVALEELPPGLRTRVLGPRDES